MSYTFVFLGETQHVSDNSKAKKILAKKFGISAAEIEALFVKGAKFERRDLSKEVAEAYLTEFTEAGAIGHVLETNELAPPVHIDIIEDTPVQQTFNMQPAAKNNQSAAYGWLKWASILILATIAADNYLQSALIVDRYGLDIGYLPLILAHIPLLIGCSILAREKGWPSTLGLLLGFLSLAGLSILLLLPYKGQKGYTLSAGNVCMTLFSCVVLLYWYNNLLVDEQESVELFAAAEALHKGRTEYPNGIQSSRDDFKREQDEMHNYMTRVIASIETNEFRPDTVSKISDRMFSEFARYLIWRKYQYFNHMSENIDLPTGLEREFTEQDRSLFKNTLRKITQNNSDPRLYESKNDWLVGVREEELLTVAGQTGDKMKFIFDAVSNAWYAQTDRRRKENRNRVIKTFDLEKMHLKKFPGADIKKYDNHFEYSFIDGPLQGKSLAIGIYMTSKTSKLSKKTFYLPKYIVLSHNYPAKYLNNILQIFDGYTN